MGTLHNAIIDTKTKQQPESSSNSSAVVSSGDKGTERRVAPKQSAAVRFVPRTTHLESRKRRMQEMGERSETDAANEPLIGPRLPETPKLDMEDESLNTTVSLIRNTLKKVTCFLGFFHHVLNVILCCQSNGCAFFLSGGSSCRCQTSGEKSETASSYLNVNFLADIIYKLHFYCFTFFNMYSCFLINQMN